MPISFSCGQCGKDYVVSDGLSGKRAVCKACGNRMTIPGAAMTAAAPAPEAQASRPRTVASPASRPAPAYQPPAGDVYGFDEAPTALPPMMPRTSGPAAEEASDSPIPKKKKKKGFFSSDKKKSSGSSFQFTGIGIGGAPAIVVVLIVIWIGSRAGMLGKFGLASKADMEGHMKELVSVADQLTTTLQPVKTAADAARVSPTAKALLTKINNKLASLKGAKGKQEEIDEVERTWGPKLHAASFAFGREIGRIWVIPGARVALAVDAEFEQLTNMKL
jgi:hypothetical protein